MYNTATRKRFQRGLSALSYASDLLIENYKEIHKKGRVDLLQPLPVAIFRAEGEITATVPFSYHCASTRLCIANSKFAVNWCWKSL